MSNGADSPDPSNAERRELAVFRSVLTYAPSRLNMISTEQAGAKPGPGRWSPKEELGHLIDSASNNHQRIVRAQLEQEPAMPGYDGDRWVGLHAYQERDWQALIELWRSLNQQFFSAAGAVAEDGWGRRLTIAGSEPLTLEFVLKDYLDHMLHHLRHIGIEVDDLKSQQESWSWR